MDGFIIKWFIIGCIASPFLLPVFVMLNQQNKKFSFETKVAKNVITQTLGILLIVAGFAFSIYGNYLTAKAGEQTMSTGEFANLANQFFIYFKVYVGLIATLFGIATGIGIVITIKNIWNHFRHNNAKTTDQSNLEFKFTTDQINSATDTLNNLKQISSIINKNFKKVQNIVSDEDNHGQEKDNSG